MGVSDGTFYQWNTLCKFRSIRDLTAEAGEVNSRIRGMDAITTVEQS
jgi:hypothetical protein